MLLLPLTGFSHPRADLILTNARIYTVDAEKPWAEAVAIAGERILTVGSTEVVAATAGPETRIIDLDGAFVSPGFNDAHVHMDSTGSLITGVNLLDVPEARERIDHIRYQLAWSLASLGQTGEATELFLRVHNHHRSSRY